MSEMKPNDWNLPRGTIIIHSSRIFPIPAQFEDLASSLFWRNG